VDLKKPLKFWSKSVFSTVVTIALQYSLAGGQGMVSSNTVIASLSHDTPKSMFGQKLLDIWVLDEFHSVCHYKNRSLQKKNWPFFEFIILAMGLILGCTMHYTRLKSVVSDNPPHITYAILMFYCQFRVKRVTYLTSWTQRSSEKVSWKPAALLLLYYNGLQTPQHRPQSQWGVPS